MRQPALSCARYQLPLGITLNSLHPITLLRIPQTPTVPVERLDGVWGVAALGDPAQLKALQVWLARPAATRELVAAMNQLPDDVAAVQLDKRFIAVFGMSGTLRRSRQTIDRWLGFGPAKSPRRPRRWRLFPA